MFLVSGVIRTAVRKFELKERNIIALNGSALYLACTDYCSLIDLALVVGFFVVSRPFLDARSTRHLQSSHSQRLEVMVV